MMKNSPNMYKIFGSELTIAIWEWFTWAVAACVVKTLFWFLNSSQKISQGAQQLVGRRQSSKFCDF